MKRPKKLIAINLSKDEAIVALVEYAARVGKINYRGHGTMSMIMFQEGGHLKQIRVEIEYEENDEARMTNDEGMTK